MIGWRGRTPINTKYIMVPMCESIGAKRDTYSLVLVAPDPHPHFRHDDR